MIQPLRLNKLFNIPAESKNLIRNHTYVGIDFGTSTTVVSIAGYNADTESIECYSLQLQQKDKFGNTMYGELFPSVVAIDLNTSKPIYGQGAYDLKWNPLYRQGINLWHSFKMELGKDIGPIWYDSQQPKIKSPKDAAVTFFKCLKRSIESAVADAGLATDIKYAVSIPASFESNQRKDLMEVLAANDIIIEGALFIDEPNAAFLGYINSNETEPITLSGEYNPKVLVFDFGAGTCDISLLEITADHQGIHSNNLSISQFAELGGNDIDRYIAYNYLLPQLLKANNLNDTDNTFTTKEKDAIATQLLGTAEQIKKRMCNEDMNYLLSDADVIRDAAADGFGIHFETPELAIETNNGCLIIDKFWISYTDFINTMEVFFKKPLFSNLGAYTVRGQQKRYNSINTAIDTAMAKAHVDKDEIDYVVMIGGSSRNPFVQQRIKSIFPEATVMIPRDLQALVSQGAALHSFLKNGLNIHAVRPIVGEPIVIVVQHGIIRVIPAGTQVPFETSIENAFTTGQKSFREIEIPVCVGSDKKLLHNLKLRRRNNEPFPQDTIVNLRFNMDSNKILHVYAETMGESWQAACENPLDNVAMTDSEANVLKAQRESYISADQNGKRPSAAALEALSRAYEDNEQEFLAAETLIEKNRYYPNRNTYNRIGVLFHNSGNYNQAISWLYKAVKEDPDNATVCSNLGHDLYLIGEYDEARIWLEKSMELKGDYAIPIKTLADIELAEGNEERANSLYRRAFNIFNRQWHEGMLDNCQKGWFRNLSSKLNETETADKLAEEMRRAKHSRGYDIDNTLFGTQKL